MQDRQTSSHHPDCASVTGDMLKPLILGGFPTGSDGVVHIPYTLFGARRLHPGSLMTELGVWFRFSSRPVPEKYAATMTNAVKSALETWTKISDNKIVFHQADHPYEARGLRFNLARESELTNMDAAAVTMTVLDNNGGMRFADLYFPDSTEFWEGVRKGQHYDVSTIAHELIHGLGISGDWPENCAAMQALQNTPDGVFCSVMPYLSRVTTDTSKCHTDCSPAYAIAPGETDIAMFKMAYTSGNSPQCYPFTWDAASAHWLNYSANMRDGFISGFMVGTCNHSLVSFGKNLAFKEAGRSSIPEKAVHVVADAGMLAAMIFLDMPVLECTVFTITALTKYLPQRALDLCPDKLKSVLTSNYSIYVFGLLQAIRRGQCLIPLVATSCGSALGTFYGTGLGDFVGGSLAKGLSYIVRTIRTKFCSSAAPQYEQLEPDLEAALPAQEVAPEPAPSRCWSSLFNPFIWVARNNQPELEYDGLNIV